MLKPLGSSRKLIFETQLVGCLRDGGVSYDGIVSIIFSLRLSGLISVHTSLI